MTSAFYTKKKSLARCYISNICHFYPHNLVEVHKSINVNVTQMQLHLFALWKVVEFLI